MSKVQPVQANLHQEVLVEALSITQVVVHIQMLEALLKAKDLLLQVRGTNMLIHHLPQWDLLPRVVGFNALSVVDVTMLEENVQIIAPSSLMTKEIMNLLVRKSKKLMMKESFRIPLSKKTTPIMNLKHVLLLS
jgi:hypothetical protein